jgi:hypothetical protein
MKVVVLTSCCMATHGEAALMTDHMQELTDLQLGDGLSICSLILWDAAFPTRSAVVTAPIRKRHHTG